MFANYGSSGFCESEIRGVAPQHTFRAPLEPSRPCPKNLGAHLPRTNFQYTFAQIF